ncbi:adenosine deaminase [Alteromonas gilva]|uniref:Adenosine deaminase n=1 Tax=Alteromonas gilva TaxID=2987522 RepID=A0ABT5L337_9ALTE|nr:adenosine deaminase [Alteromonas gilva]MDC8831449.1 adenosine deaminase [Alteromonas gilva]
MSLGVQVAKADEMDKWFRDFKQTASPTQLYAFLWALPKGGDLHNHLSGAGYSEWWYDIATDQTRNGGYQYYTKVKINQCLGYGANEYGAGRQLLLFKTIQASTYRGLTRCQQQEYKKMEALSEDEKQGFLNSIRLDKDYEGRNEFFEAHWSRLNELPANPHVIAYILLKNMQAFGNEGLQYLETQVGVRGKLKADGSRYTPEEALAILTTMLDSEEAQATGVTVKFQYTVLRFAPSAEDDLRWVYGFIDRHRDSYVGINFAGREDNDKGYPLRFLPVLRELRNQYPAIPLAIHAGEVDEPNRHVRDTLLLGAQRIGHGLNTITDPDTLLLMRHGPYLIEINLISNHLLEYTEDYSNHPFGEYLRTDIPVALSTDDRGMWDSTMTDEYYIAVNEFNLSWQELISLGENSLKHSFLPETDKQQALATYRQRLAEFTRAIINNHTDMATDMPAKRQFICRYQPDLCHQG